jgi:hypothetical protein
VNDDNDEKRWSLPVPIRIGMDREGSHGREGFQESSSALAAQFKKLFTFGFEIPGFEQIEWYVLAILVFPNPVLELLRA